MLVTTAMSGLSRIEMSWKLDSSATAKSPSRMSRMSGMSARPMLPPTCTRLPASLRISAISVVVVVLAVAAGDADRLAGAEVEKELHLARDGDPVAAQPLQHRVVELHPRRAQDDVRVDVFEIVLPEAELDPRAPQNCCRSPPPPLRGCGGRARSPSRRSRSAG